MKHTTSETLGLIQVGQDLGYPLELLKPQITIRYSWFDVEKLNILVNPDEAFDSRRNQYHSTRILVLLEKQMESLKVERLLGVADFDLYVPEMNFVFGEARCPGPVGIVSTHRLKPSSFSENQVFHQRVVKEAVHEIGHMLGLRHCPDDLCVMYFSEHILDTDRKSAELCRKCKSKLEVLEAE